MYAFGKGDLIKRDLPFLSLFYLFLNKSIAIKKSIIDTT
jgi:hypothetical protein